MMYHFTIFKQKKSQKHSLPNAIYKSKMATTDNIKFIHFRIYWAEIFCGVARNDFKQISADNPN